MLVKVNGNLSFGNSKANSTVTLSFLDLNPPRIS
jgi:hypothetical protein